MRKFGGSLVPSLLCVSLLSTARSLACPAGAVCCNNVEACDLPVNEILFGMVHNAMASPSAGFVFFPNHLNDPIVESLEYGTIKGEIPAKSYDSDCRKRGKVDLIVRVFSLENWNRLSRLVLGFVQL